MENWKIENTERERSSGGRCWRRWNRCVRVIWLNSTLNFHRGHFTVPSNYSATPLIQHDGKICQQNSGEGAANFATCVQLVSGLECE